MLSAIVYGLIAYLHKFGCRVFYDAMVIGPGLSIGFLPEVVRLMISS